MRRFRSVESGSLDCSKATACAPATCGQCGWGQQLADPDRASSATLEANRGQRIDAVDGRSSRSAGHRAPRAALVRRAAFMHR